MATDNSPPKIRVILTIAFSSVVILGALGFVFQSYFQMMSEQAELEHLRPAQELLTLREGEARNLASGPMPIGNAMKALASARDRSGMKDIEPQPSNDTGALVGWIKTPNLAALEALTAAADDAGAAGAGGTATDGGAGVAPALAAGTDGGPSLAASSDAGVAPKATKGAPANGSPVPGAPAASTPAAPAAPPARGTAPAPSGSATH